MKTSDISKVFRDAFSEVTHETAAADLRDLAKMTKSQLEKSDRLRLDGSVLLRESAELQSQSRDVQEQLRQSTTRWSAA